jgi:hypothetical protein
MSEGKYTKCDGCKNAPEGSKNICEYCPVEGAKQFHSENKKEYLRTHAGFTNDELACCGGCDYRLEFPELLDSNKTLQARLDVSVKALSIIEGLNHDTTAMSYAYEALKEMENTK